MFNHYKTDKVPNFHRTFKPSPAVPASNEFLVEYIASDTMDRLDIFACNSKINSLIVFFNDQISIMSHLKWQPVAKNIKLLGLTGHPLQYYLFAADATNVVQNFGS